MIKLDKNSKLNKPSTTINTVDWLIGWNGLTSLIGFYVFLTMSFQSFKIQYLEPCISFGVRETLHLSSGTAPYPEDQSSLIMKCASDVMAGHVRYVAQSLASITGTIKTTQKVLIYLIGNLRLILKSESTHLRLWIDDCIDHLKSV